MLVLAGKTAQIVVRDNVWAGQAPVLGALREGRAASSDLVRATCRPEWMGRATLRLLAQRRIAQPLPGNVWQLSAGAERPDLCPDRTRSPQDRPAP